MVIKKVPYAKVKCPNTLCYDRLPNGVCDMEEDPTACLLSKAFNKVGEAIHSTLLNAQETWNQIKGGKLKDVANPKGGTIESK